MYLYEFSISQEQTQLPATMRFMVFRDEYLGNIPVCISTLSYLPTRKMAEDLVADLTTIYRKSGTLREAN